MDGLIQPGGCVTDGCGWQQTDGAGDHAGLIREDVAKHIFRHHHVKLGGIPDQLHGGVVHQNILILHIGVLLRQAVHDGAPQAAGLQHVGLVHAGHLPTAQAGQLKGAAADALDLQLGVGHPVGGLLSPVLGLITFPLAEVDAAGELPDHHQVDPFFGCLLFQGAGVRHGWAQDGGAQIGIQAQIPADGQ